MDNVCLCEAPRIKAKFRRTWECTICGKPEQPNTAEAAHPAPATVESGGLSRNDICRLWQDAAINRPNLTVEGFTNLLLCEIDDRAALAPATEGRKG